MRRRFFKNLPDAPAVNFKPLAKEFARWDILQFVVMLLLLAAGVLFIYTTGEQIGSQLSRGFWKKQLVWIAFGFAAYIAAARCDYRKLIPWVWFYYIFSVAMLILVLFIGIKVNGAVSWIDLKFMRLQPSEFAKLGVIWFLAAMHGNMLFKISKLPHIFLSLAALALPIGLIAVEPDFGSAAVLLPVGAIMVFTAGINWKYIAFAVALMVLAAGAFTVNEVLEIKPLLKTYQKERIKTFLNPERDIANRGYNAYQSRLAVGSGGMWGKGLGQGTQNPLGFLPRKVSNNDFIFSVIAEETGFAGALALITAYILLIYTVLRSAFFAVDSFARQSGIGIAVLIFVHLFINIGMSIGVTPITGLPLPFLSYGGSFVVSMMLALGFMQSVYRRNVLSQEEDREFSS